MAKFYKIQTLIQYKKSSLSVQHKLKKKSNVLGHIIHIDQPPLWKRNDSSDEDFLIKLITNEWTMVLLIFD